MKPVNCLTSTFDKKWTSYALASGAMLIAPSAHASVITFTQNISLFSDSGTDSGLLDVDQDGTNDYSLLVSATGGVGLRFVSVQGLNGNQIFLNPFDGVDFAAVVPLGSDPALPTSGGLAYILRDEVGLSGSIKVKGNWHNDLTNFQYMGLQFTSNGNTYMGWASVSAQIGSAALTINESAYETTALTPEPSSMALMLLGAAGVAALKLRRRNAQ